jgi:putative ABC transport system substrate-binding protein
MSICIRRREFVTALGSAVAWPLVLRAQSAVQVVGFLYNTTAAVFPNDRLSAFRRGLNEAGFAEGRNVAIEFRFADDQLERLPALAADLVRRQVVVIVANGASLPAGMAATSSIPIVFVGGNDPVKDGFVTSLSRPGGNITGVSFNTPALNGKRLELLHELIPKSVLIAVLLDPKLGPADQVQEVQAAARSLGRQIMVVQATNESEFDAAFATIVRSGAGALFVGTSSFLNSQRRQLVAFATRHALPASYEQREFAEVGGLMSYGASTIDAYRRAGLYVGRILRGEKPGDLPVELPTKYELIFNLATAKALGIEIPPNLRALADEIIE